VLLQAPVQERMLRCDLSSLHLRPFSASHRRECPQEDRRAQLQLLLAKEEHHLEVAVAQVAEVGHQHLVVAWAEVEAGQCLEALVVVEEVPRRLA
jgi:hypothetical protein